LKHFTHISYTLKKVVKYVPVLFIVPLLTHAEERSGLLLNGTVSAEHTDNVLNNLNEISDTALIIAPEVKYLGYIGKHEFLFNYDGELATYADNSDFNYNAHKVAVGARLDHSHKINTEFNLGFDKRIETPGSTNSSTQTLTDFNKYNSTSALARLYYGQKNSTGQIVISYTYKELDYTNNQQDFRDNEQNKLSATFFYRIAPKTRLLFQATAAEFTYNDQQLTSGLIFNQSNNENTYLAGVEWETTAKTTGLFKIGYEDNQFDDIRFSDTSELSYFLDMIWKPSTYTRIKFGASRETIDSALLNEGGFLSTSYTIDVSHYIKPRTEITARLIIDNDEIITGVNRTDKRNSVKVGINHSLREWLNIKLAYEYQERTSDIELFGFESNNIQLSLETVF
jgi:hypothetical protein